MSKNTKYYIIRLVQKGLFTQEIGAYLSWYRDIDGYDNPYAGADNIPTKVTSNMNIFYQYLVYEFYRYKNLYAETPLEIFINLMQYSLDKTFWAQYTHYFELSKLIVNPKEKKLISFKQVSLGQMPFIAIWYDTDNMNYYLLEL